MLCPACKAHLADTAATCEFCTARIAIDYLGAPRVVFPEIRPGEVIFALDFRNTPLPSKAERERKFDDGDSYRAAPEGILVDAVNNVTWPFSQMRFRIRDVCVRAACITM